MPAAAGTHGVAGPRWSTQMPLRKISRTVAKGSGDRKSGTGEDLAHAWRSQNVIEPLPGHADGATDGTWSAGIRRIASLISQQRKSGPLSTASLMPTGLVPDL